MPRKKLIAKDAIKQYPESILANLELLKKQKGQWTTNIFQNDNPLEIEVGSGKGKFLNTKALQHPQTNFLALEIKEERTLSAAKKALLAKLDNIRFLCTNIKYLDQIFAPRELSGLYINFPDPWPKKRHIKRRLAAPEFIKLYEQLLREGGFVELKTDNQLFWHYACSQFLQRKWKIDQISLNHPNNKNNIETEFENKFRQKQQPIYFVRFIKTF